MDGFDGVTVVVDATNAAGETSAVALTAALAGDSPDILRVLDAGSIAACSSTAACGQSAPRDVDAWADPGIIGVTALISDIRASRSINEQLL